MTDEPIIDRKGQRVVANILGERVEGIVDHSTWAPSHNETQHIINEPEDGRRPIAVRESELSRAESIAVGYAGRTHPNFRYAGDKREIHLEISAEAAKALLDTLRERQTVHTDVELELQRVLDDVLNDRLIGFA